ncbi:hypothetical protein BSKO_04210 [Bryopsis sp. KO-2023]|nr:hypothetical protein BSKO_04210 [Bryopsis sp. KO-2023]
MKTMRTTLSGTGVDHLSPARAKHPSRSPRTTRVCATTDPLLLRVARGEEAERTPVWLMRQAGRYMAEFRKYSDKYPFRLRSETPDIAIELSLQPWRAYKPDGVIMFSDILTPLPALGIEFDVIKGKGPVIETPIRSMEQVKSLSSIDDPLSSLPFVNEILSSLRKEVDNQAALFGFIGTPWTLAAYAMEGSANKNCLQTKKIMLQQPEILHAFLDHLADSLITYVGYQIESGAQIVQLFDSWAHHLSPDQFAEFSLPYAEKVIQGVRAKHPDVPLIFHMNGGTGKLEFLSGCSADVIGLDWHVDMGVARKTLGNRIVQGNVDPLVLFGKEEDIRGAVTKCIQQAGPTGHILNLGHGVVQGTPEESVGLFCDLARESASLFDKELVSA